MFFKTGSKYRISLWKLLFISVELIAVHEINKRHSLK